MKSDKTTPFWDSLLSMEYRDCRIEGDTDSLYLHLKSEQGTQIEVWIDGNKVGSWKPIYSDVRIPLQRIPDKTFTLSVRMRGGCKEYISSDTIVF